MDDIYFEGKPIIIKVHAVKRARQRNIAYPDQVYNVLNTGKIKRLGRMGLNLLKNLKKVQLYVLERI